MLQVLYVLGNASVNLILQKEIRTHLEHQEQNTVRVAA